MKIKIKYIKSGETLQYMSNRFFTKEQVKEIMGA